MNLYSFTKAWRANQNSHNAINSFLLRYEKRNIALKASFNALLLFGALLSATAIANDAQSSPKALNETARKITPIIMMLLEQESEPLLTFGDTNDVTRGAFRN